MQHTLHDASGSVVLCEAPATDPQSACVSCGGDVEAGAPCVAFSGPEGQCVYCHVDELTALLRRIDGETIAAPIGKTAANIIYGVGEQLPTAQGTPCASCDEDVQTDDLVYLLQDYTDGAYLTYHVACWGTMAANAQERFFEETADKTLNELL